jgi:hypothetical protein
MKDTFPEILVIGTSDTAELQRDLCKELLASNLVSAAVTPFGENTPMERVGTHESAYLFCRVLIDNADCIVVLVTNQFLKEELQSSFQILNLYNERLKLRKPFVTIPVLLEKEVRPIDWDNPWLKIAHRRLWPLADVPKRLATNVLASLALEKEEEHAESRALSMLIDPGTAPAEEIARLLTELSTLYKMLGGSGITFQVTDCREPSMETA